MPKTKALASRTVTFVGNRDLDNDGTINRADRGFGWGEVVIVLQFLSTRALVLICLLLAYQKRRRRCWKASS